MDSIFSRKPSSSSQQLNTSLEANKNTETTQPGTVLNTSTESQLKQNIKEKEKEKKDSSAMSFVKRLTKRSKSPSTSATPSYSMDNPVFEDTSIPTTSSNRANINLSHPVHVRYVSVIA